MAGTMDSKWEAAGFSTSSFQDLPATKKNLRNAGIISKYFTHSFALQMAGLGQSSGEPQSSARTLANSTPQRHPNQDHSAPCGRPGRMTQAGTPGCHSSLTKNTVQVKLGELALKTACVFSRLL